MFVVILKVIFGLLFAGFTVLFARESVYAFSSEERYGGAMFGGLAVVFLVIDLLIWTML